MPRIEDDADTQQIDDVGEQVDNQVEDVDGHSGESSDGDGGEGESGSSGASAQRERYFLDIDERHRYRTADDAKKAYSEANQRIAQLSAWEKELKEYGELSPADVRQYLDELISARQELQQAQTQIRQFHEEKQRQQSEAAKKSSPGSTDDGEQLTADEKAARAWLAKTIPGLGYVPKDDVMKLFTELQGRLGQFETYREQQQAQYKESLVSDSRVKLSSWMQESGFADDEDGSVRMLIEGQIRDWINADDRRVTRFYMGGSTTEQLLKEGYDRASKTLGLIRGTQSQSSQSSQSATSYAKNKADALKRNPKRLPNQGVARASNSNSTNGAPKKRIDASGKRDFIGEQHNKAWEVANGRWGGSGDGE